MNYIQDAFGFLIVIVLFIGMVKVCMWVANDIGEKLGIGKFIINLWKKIMKRIHLEKNT